MSGFFSISTEDEALLVVKNEPAMVVSLPEGLLTTEVLFAALTRSEAVFDMLDPVFYNHDLIGQLLVFRPEYFSKLPRKLIKEDHLVSMAQTNGVSLQFIPAEMLNEKICLIAIDQNVQAHEFVPEKLQNVNYLNKLIKNDPNYVRLVDIARRDAKTLRTLVEAHPVMIRFMRMTDRCIEVCQDALKDSIHNVQYFPEKIYDQPDMIKQMGDHAYFQGNSPFDANLIRPKLAEYLVQNYPDCYDRLPLSAKTLELAKLAIQHRPLNILITPSSLKRDGKLWEYTLGIDKELYPHIPLNEQSDNVRLFIAQQKAMKKNKQQNSAKTLDNKVAASVPQDAPHDITGEPSHA